MDGAIRSLLDKAHLRDRPVQTEAYYQLMALTENPVEWAYDAWDGLIADLADKDNHVRSIAAQLLCHLAAKSDPAIRIRKDFPALLAVTKDGKFVTARHTLQVLWKIGIAGKEQRQLLLDGLSRRFDESGTEKSGTLIRFDIAQGLRRLYDATGDNTVKQQALALIETEADVKYRKKYATVWENT